MKSKVFGRIRDGTMSRLNDDIDSITNVEGLE
jgi:hypothetical protein